MVYFIRISFHLFFLSVFHTLFYILACCMQTPLSRRNIAYTQDRLCADLAAYLVRNVCFMMCMSRLVNQNTQLYGIHSFYRFHPAHLSCLSGNPAPLKAPFSRPCVDVIAHVVWHMND